jgi:adenosylcobinamide kinase/adenosylcobinamide-phosphate guanylyltransferase
MPERHLILGGARSGKTNHAITLAASRAAARGEPVVYVATAQALDDEMQHRIARIVRSGRQSWQTVEAPDRSRRRCARKRRRFCSSTVLTLWLSNALLLDFDEAAPLRDVAALGRRAHGISAVARRISRRRSARVERSRVRHRAGVRARAAVSRTSKGG